MKALLISPYWDILGGGEKYLLSIGQYLHKQHYQVQIAWSNPKIKEQLLNHFGKDYEFVKINSNWNKLGSWQKLFASKQFQIIFYHSDGSYFFSLAKKNFQLLQVPSKQLLPQRWWLEKLKFSLWTPIFNSLFTGNFFLKNTQIKKSFLLYPPTENILQTPPKKKPLILSVGRFFSHLHSKKQEILIKAFIYGITHYPEFKKYHLLLVGGFKREDQAYLNSLQQLKQNYPNIEIRTNISHSQIQTLYRQAQFYWHASGYQVDEKKDPEQVEHFGISIVEAMANYCVPIVYPAGGPKEIVKREQTGLFFHTPKQLITQTLRLIKNPNLSQSIAHQARNQAEKEFGPTAFNNSLAEIIR